MQNKIEYQSPQQKSKFHELQQKQTQQYQEIVSEYKQKMQQDQPWNPQNFEQQQEFLKNEHQRQQLVQANIMKQNIFKRMEDMEKRREQRKKQTINDYKLKIELESNYQKKQKDDKLSSFKDDIIMNDNIFENSYLKNVAYIQQKRHVELIDAQTQHQITDEEQLQIEEDLQRKLEHDQSVEQLIQQLMTQNKLQIDANQDLFNENQYYIKKISDLEDIVQDQEILDQKFQTFEKNLQNRFTQKSSFYLNSNQNFQNL